MGAKVKASHNFYEYCLIDVTEIHTRLVGRLQVRSHWQRWPRPPFSNLSFSRTRFYHTLGFQEWVHSDFPKSSQSKCLHCQSLMDNSVSKPDFMQILSLFLILEGPWELRCRSEGRRLDEKEFIIDRPQVLSLSGRRRRKSMEPGKVLPLGDGESGNLFRIFRKTR